ncbi:MAG: hypothetical protein V9G22_15655, partial [Ottowia sp.]
MITPVIGLGTTGAGVTRAGRKGRSPGTAWKSIRQGAPTRSKRCSILVIISGDVCLFERRVGQIEGCAGEEAHRRALAGEGEGAGGEGLGHQRGPPLS